VIAGLLTTTGDYRPRIQALNLIHGRLTVLERVENNFTAFP
jgi:hypothetical protein